MELIENKMDKLKRIYPVELSVTPKEVADLFCSMDNNEQADFFNAVADNVKEWGSLFIFQLQEIVNTEKLTEPAKQIMREIGYYADSISLKQERELVNK